MKVVIPINKLKAANCCKATKDIRYYLEGIFLDERGFIVSTDGHTMYVGDLEYNGPNYLFKLQSIPAKVTVAELDTELNIITFGFSTGEPVSMSVQVIDGRFPDWQRVFNSFDKERPVTEIGIGAKAMAKVCKVALCFDPKKSFLLELGKSSADAMRILLTKSDRMILMPARY